MKVGPLVAAVAMVLAFCGCGGGSAPPPTKPFAIEGDWTYLGPSDVPHTLTITGSSMVYDDVDGAWTSSWTIKSYDDDRHRFQLAFASGSGMYLPTGQSLSGSYDLSGSLLTVQLAKGLDAYPSLQSAGSCTNGSDGTPLPDCRLYIKQN